MICPCFHNNTPLSKAKGIRGQVALQDAGPRLVNQPLLVLTS
jgi:hypothetical protein